MITENPVGPVIAVLGAAGLIVSALADPLGIGEGEVFGWLQITGVVAGAVVTLLGVAMTVGWVPYPARRTETSVSSGSQTNIVLDDDASEHRTP